jgi:glycosyltransferase involved in cell wall biosynthesis
MARRRGEYPVVAVVHEENSPFVLQDIKILRHITRTIDVRCSSSGLRNPRQYFRLVSDIARSDIVIVWFTSGLSIIFSLIISKALGKKYISIAGGTDIARDKAVKAQYRLFAGMPIGFFLTNLVLRASDLVIGVSQFTDVEISDRVRPQKRIVIYNGIDTGIFKPGEEGDQILTVARSRPEIKGIDRFLAIARLLPHRTFVIVGQVCYDHWVIENAPANVKLVGTIRWDELVTWYRKAKIYCQLSRYETFGVAVAEAMACGCIPVVSDSGPLPEIVDGCGVIVPGGDSVRASEAIESLWDDHEFLRERSRERIVDVFSTSKRESALRELLLTM